MSAEANQHPRKLEAAVKDGRGKVLVAVTALALLVMFFARIDDWLYKNETFNNLAMGLNVAADHPSLVALRDAAMANCETSAAGDVGDCRKYQIVITQNLFFGEAIQSLFGWRLAKTYGERPWLSDVHRAVISALLTSCAVMIALWLAFTVALPAAERTVVSAVTLVLILLGYFRDDPTLILPDPFDAGTQAWEGPALVAVVAAIVLALPRARAPLAALSDRALAAMPAIRSRPWVALIGLLLVQMILPAAGTAVVQVLSLGVLALLLATYLRDRALDPGALLIFVCLLFILISGDRSILPRKFEVPRNEVFLVFGAYLAYAAARPRGALVWALPAIGVFHPSVAMLSSLALALAEGLICVRRRKVTRVLVSALITLAIGLALMRLFDGNLVGLTGAALVDVIAMMLAEPWRLASLLAVLALVGVLTLRPLLSSDPSNDALALAGLLAMQALAASTIADVINRVDPAFASTPGYFLFANLPGYLNRGITFGAVLVLAVWLLGREGAPEAPGQRAAHDPARLWRFTGQVVAILIVIGVAKVDLTVKSLVYAAGRNLVVDVVQQRLDANWCRYLSAAQGNDDHYVLSAVNPVNGPEIYFSVLKLKARIVAGVHDPARMTIGLPPPEAGGCG